MSRRRKIVIALLAVVLLLVAARVALPYLVEDLVNDRLAALDAYDGHVSDIDIQEVPIEDVIRQIFAR